MVSIRGKPAIFQASVAVFSVGAVTSRSSFRLLLLILHVSISCGWLFGLSGISLTFGGHVRVFFTLFLFFRLRS